MKSYSIYVLATIMSLSAVGAASAQQNTNREAMIHKCILEAVAQYPRTPDSNDSARTAAYKACMANAGLAP